MPIDKFIIGYTDDKSGLQTNFQPWLLPDNAFTTMTNVYAWRGRIKKRIGSTLMGGQPNASRLRIQSIPLTIAAGPPETGTVNFTVGGVGIPIITIAVGMVFELGFPGPFIQFTVVDTAGGNCLSTVPGIAITASVNGNILTITNNTGGAFALPATIYLYPALPVTGIGQYENPATNDETTVAFDTQFAYFYSGVDWQRLTGGEDQWTGSDSELFWIANYRGATASENYLWVSNYNATDGIRYRTAIAGGEWRKPTLFYSKGTVIGQTDGAGNFVGALGSPPVVGSVVIVANTAFVVLTGLLPAGFQPMGVVPLTTSAAVGTATCDFAAGNINIAASVTPAPNTNVYYSNQLLITSARIVVQFKNRLLLLNTKELVGGTTTIFKNRCRFSAVGNPVFGSSGTVYTSVSFMSDLAGFGNAIDAATQEAIIGAEFLKDRLIVYFERSTWELVYTGNQIYPFTWQKINTELGAESTFSTIPFDKTVLGFGNVGIHSCTGANVVRIDEKIPNLVFDLHNEQAGLNRVVGIRNYQPEVAIWTYPGGGRTATTPWCNNLLIYNYINNSWGIFDDSYTFLGYYQTSQADPTPAATWGATYTTWAETLDVWGGAQGDTNAIKSLKIVGGNQQGWVHLLDYNMANNAPGLLITGISNDPDPLVINTVMAINDPIYITSINHNLAADSYIALANLNGITLSYGAFVGLDRVVGQVIEVVNENKVRIALNKYNATTNPPSLDAVYLSSSVPLGTYNGNGTMARVSIINLLSKDFNLYVGKDYNAYISRINFLVTKTPSNYIRVNYNIGTARSLGLPLDNNLLLGNSILETSPYDLAPYEQFQELIWHNVYLSADGEFVQIQLQNPSYQPFDFTITAGTPNTTAYKIEQDFEMHSMIIYAQPTSSGLQ
jgi:hypothetical protein